MALWAIVPVKPLRRGKSRLAGVLSEDERALLNYSLLGNTLRTLSSVPEVSQILVVSSDPAALSLAREYGARTVQEEGHPDLGLAMRRAMTVAEMYQAQDVLILPADLPLLSRLDIQKILELAVKPPVVVIAPDRKSKGTNALYMNPVGVIDYFHGDDSYHNHIQDAIKKGVRTEVCPLTSLGLDLDRPEDLNILAQIEALKSNS